MSPKGILVYSLVDWDKSGREIHDSHAKFLKLIGDLDLKPWGLDREQLQHVGLSTQEPAQIDGAFGLNPRWWRTEIRKLLRIDGA